MVEVVRGDRRGDGHDPGDGRRRVGYRWMVFTDPDTEGLVVAMNAVSTRPPAAATGTGPARSSGSRTQGPPAVLDLQLQARRVYPFVPAGGAHGATEHELQLKAKVTRELPVEAELERWFPLWGIPI